ncbi:hypothetical protein [Nocardia wallacei]|uniref:hypothetical protein n=1 Tax=Nocardia wallacei TaxID=480035 RepID=UPI0024550F4C|nr:hypothetical protein [Nocardia wallacei]
MTSVDDLDELGADSIVIQGPNELSDRLRPYQRGDDGGWYAYGVQRGGIRSERLWAAGGDIVLVHVSERPVTGGLTQTDRVRAEARFRGWVAQEIDRNETRFERRDVKIDVRYSPSTGNLTKAVRRRPDTNPERSAAVGHLGTVLRWLGEDDVER